MVNSVIKTIDKKNCALINPQVSGCLGYLSQPVFTLVKEERKMVTTSLFSCEVVWCF